MKTAPVQQAVYDRLVSYPAVNDAVAGVYTEVPQSAWSEQSSDYPFITVNLASVTPDDTKTDNGATALIDVHVWSRSHSALTWRAIADNVYEALQKYDDLPVAGVNVIDCRFEGATESDDPDGVTHHQIGTYRVNYRF